MSYPTSNARRGTDAPAATALHVGGSDLGRIRAVLLDVDGTLYRQGPVRLTMAAEMMAFPLARGSVRELRRLLGIVREFRRVREELRQLGAGAEPLERLQYLETARRIGTSARDVEEAVAEWMFQRPLKHLRRWKSSGVDMFLDVACRRGVVIGALSDFPVADKLAALGVAHYFSLALCTTDRQINAFKPHPRGFLKPAECGGSARRRFSMSAIDRTLTHPAPAPQACPASLSGASVAVLVEDGMPSGTSASGALPISRPDSPWSDVLEHVRPYVRLARIDHWFKNAFMILGVVLAFFYEPALFTWRSAGLLGLALLATCLVASSNYVLNELLDGPTDRLHPKKRLRPVPAGQIRTAVAYSEWIALGAAGLVLAWTVNEYFFASAVLLWLLGITYNVPPIRTKEWAYLDVVSESANNAVRLLLGWFPLITDRFPPVSLILSYWMIGAFFMAAKRLAEYRHIGNPAVAAAYRRSFAHYNEERLIVSLVFYATGSALFAGIFIVRYHLELILFTPVAAGVVAYYLKVGLQPDSPVQNPEKLYKERGFLAFMVGSVALFIVLMFTSMPGLYEWFNVEASAIAPLWTLDGWTIR